MPTELSITDARRLALHGQGLLRAPSRRGAPATRVLGVVRALGAVQLDTISVLARSHELVPFARLGPVGRDAVAAAYWGTPHRCVEYWAHAACVIPVEDWPWWEWRRRRSRNRSAAGSAAQGVVLERLREHGASTATDLGGARGGGPWWDWSPVKVAAEELLARGDIVCVERRGWRRVYDLAERALPAAVRGREPDDAECHRYLLAAAGARCGVGTVADLADYCRLPLAAARAALPDTELIAVRVEGWAEPAWAHPAALEALAAGGLRGRGRTALLSPFDSLVWERRRTLRLFGFTHRLEAYTPAADRVHGYFVMPLLSGGRLRGRVDVGRRGSVLQARRVVVERGAEPAMAAALREAATWVGCDEVAIGAVVPPSRTDALTAALAA